MSGLPALRVVSENAVLDLKETDYDMTADGGPKGTSYKVIFPVMGATHEIKISQDQYRQFLPLKGRPVKIIGTVGRSKGGVPLIHIDEVVDEGAKRAA